MVVLRSKRKASSPKRSARKRVLRGTKQEIKLSGPHSSKGTALARPTIASVTINSTRPKQNTVSLEQNGDKVLLYHSIADDRTRFQGRWYKWVSLKDVYNVDKGVISATVPWEIRGGRETRDVRVTIRLTPAGKKLVDKLML